MPSARTLSIFVAMLGAATAPALAQCQLQWSPSLPANQSFNGFIYALKSWNGKLYACGNFSSPASAIAVFDGTSWSQMPFNSFLTESFAVFRGELIASGELALNGANVAHWTGAAWEPIGSGFTSGLWLVTEWNGKLVATSGPNLYFWDGSTWTTLALPPPSDFLADAAVLQGELFVSAVHVVQQIGFIRTYRWSNGWVSEPIDNVHAMTEFHGDLIAAGGSGIARRHNGVWSVMGGFGNAGALGQFGDTLLVSIPGIGQAAAWNGASWNLITPGLSGYPPVGDAPRQFEVHDDAVWTTGTFTLAGGQPSPYLARLICACYANCDQSITAPLLNTLDFQCFLTRYAAQSSYANCDNSTTQPTLNVLDFQCFLNKFAAGCT